MTEDHELNLPVFEHEPLPPSVRSLDEIIDWIDETYRDFFDREVYERQKRRNSVTIAFKLD